MAIDVMLDLETLGTSAGCVVLSIGACTFNKSVPVRNFYHTISIEDSIQHGLLVNPDTEAWWNRQNPIVKAEAFSGTASLQEALGNFSDWMSQVAKAEGQIYLWGNGADFDLPILQAAYEAAGIKRPWLPFNGRCYRTLKNLRKDIAMPAFIGKHNALNDAKAQAAHAEKLLAALLPSQHLQD